MAYLRFVVIENFCQKKYEVHADSCELSDTFGFQLWHVGRLRVKLLCDRNEGPDL